MARSSAEKMGGRLPQIHRISRGGRKLAVEFSQSHVAVFWGKVSQNGHDGKYDDWPIATGLSSFILDRVNDDEPEDLVLYGYTGVPYIVGPQTIAELLYNLYSYNN